MKALSIKELYVSEIISGEKTIEYRTWQTKHRGDLLLCTSLTMENGLGSFKKYFPVGYATVVVELYNITKDEDEERLFNWHIRNPRLIKPIKIKGKLNIYEVDDELIEYVPEIDPIECYEFWRNSDCLKDNSLTEYELYELINKKFEELYNELNIDEK